MSLEPFTSQQTDEWATPPEFVRPLSNAIGGFDIDSAAGAERSPIAETAFTEGDDGLSQSWHGKIWCNPPYSDIGPWLRKALSEVRQDRAEFVVALVKGDTSTDWFQRYGTQADLFMFVNGRLQFGSGGMDAPFPSLVLVYGELPKAGVRALRSHGTVIEPTIVEETTQTSLAGASE